MKQKISIVLMGLFLTTSVFAQNMVVHGKLTVFNTFPVMNIEVSAKKAKTTIVTDSLGQFSLVCFENDMIRIRSKAFKPVNKKVESDTDSLTINLLFIDNKSNREVAVGYGYIKEEDLNYGINHLEQQNNDFCNYANIFDLVRGRFSGVTISGGNVYIRGSGSFSGQTQALYIVNGTEVGDIGWIQPCEIKSIDILKDTSAAIYGTRGGNGVVLIETVKTVRAN